MKTTIGQIANESISFQDGSLFKALTESVNLHRSTKADTKIRGNKYFGSPSFEAILKVIFEATGIRLVGKEGGPAIMPPAMSPGHIFREKWVQEWIEEGMGSAAHDAVKLMKAKRAGTLLRGTVDLKNSRVSGCYSDLVLDFYMPRDMMIGTTFTAEEVSAIILHEVGHAFTFFEYVSRTVTTNQLVACMTRCLDGTLDDGKITTIFGKVADEGRLDSEKAKALASARSEEVICSILIDAEIQEMESVLGASVYDVNSCEFLADQFSVRHGAGVHLASGLDKLMYAYVVLEPFTRVKNWAVFVCMGVGVAGAVGGVIAFFLYLVLGGLLQFKEDEIYDNPGYRLERIRHGMLAQLKVIGEDDNRIKQIHKDIATVEEMFAKYDQDLNIFGKIAYMLKPGFRRAHKYEQLQKDLERISHSGLFVAASKFNQFARGN